MLTRKNFKELAKHVTEVKALAKTTGEIELMRFMAEHLVTFCGQTNERFSREKFLKACGY